MSDGERQFPILPHRRDRQIERRSVPWSLVEPHREQAMRNHYQTLERLAERGGLGWCEMAAVLEDRKWHKMDEQAARERVEALAALKGAQS